MSALFRKVQLQRILRIIIRTYYYALVMLTVHLYLFMSTIVNHNITGMLNDYSSK